MATLSAVKAYLKEHRRATLGQIALGVDAEPEAVLGLLAVWQAKDRVRVVSPDCGSCGQSRFGGCTCGSSHILPDVWEWTEAGDAA